ncbi:SCP-like protein [Oesophagostomum dentatum]|uniref:SCP-like protein n=1 Tax=Oesophagostomum dentatum TaxID=61180 RepID=A0A0B1TMH9_OESDE|nr:SCP-like protein [Oesophagostomum dentatum]
MTAGISRSLLAIGTAKNGGTGQMCETSINMPTLVYDCELEKAAYERAKLCENFADNTTHIFHENRWKYIRSLDDEFELIANRVTQRWWSELDKSAGIPQPENIYTTGLNINSFAKIASDLTIRLGCGIYKCTDMVNVVCHYETALEEGRRLYITGPKCQKCAKTCAVGLCPTVAEGVHV